MTVPIPQIEGFQPIPNAVMIPFMEAQSAALAYGFGLNYEYGKRKIRSMSNDEFNSLTSEQITNMSNEHTHIILSKFQAQVPRVMPMQQEIFKQYVTIEKAKLIQNIELAKWLVDYVATGASEGIEQFFTNLFGGSSPLDPNRPTSIAQIDTSNKSLNLTENLGITAKTYNSAKNITIKTSTGNKTASIQWWQKWLKAERAKINLLRNQTASSAIARMNVMHKDIIIVQTILNKETNSYN